MLTAVIRGVIGKRKPARDIRQHGSFTALLPYHYPNIDNYLYFRMPTAIVKVNCTNILSKELLNVNAND